MLLTERDTGGRQSGEAVTLESPFLETGADNAAAPRGFSESYEALTPFLSDIASEQSVSETEHMLAEALAELRDEGFSEALTYLAEETEQAVSDRFTDEGPVNPAEREHFAEAHLAGVGFEAEQYLNALEAGLSGLDIASLTYEQLDEKLDQFDPATRDLTPAGEEFVGSLIKKAKGAVKFVAKAAKKVGKVAGSLLGPVLKKLKGLIRPLLKRVLAMAIGRLPGPLQAPARMLASKIKLEAEDESEAEDAEMDGEMSPANIADPESLAEQFDEALAEALASDRSGDPEYLEEYLDQLDQENRAPDGRQLERLAEARGQLIEALRSGDEHAVGPAVEQFVPALLGALKIGINLVGRSKVVNFLAGFLAKLIGRWVGPKLSKPLSSAIVDMGLRLISLEAEDEQYNIEEAAPVALASVIEDTVRRLAEQEDYVFEHEELTELAVAEAFGQAVATHFPPQFVRPDLRQSATLGGTFVARRPKAIRTYRKYSRIPEIEITPQIADALPSFGGATLGSMLRASGATLPMKARVHIYQSAPGTTLSSIARNDRTLGSARRGFTPSGSFHPLTPAAAGVLLREPRLGVRVPPAFLRSPRRIAVGQRVYMLQPVGTTDAAQAPAAPRAARAAQARLAAGRGRIRIDRRRGSVTIGLFLSEADAQRIASQIRSGQGHAVLLQALTRAYRELDPRSAPAAVLREDEQLFEDLAPGAARAGRLQPALARRMRGWILPALVKWVSTNAEAFVRAAASPESGVSVTIRLSGVPGLNARPHAQRTAGTPAIAITVRPGRH